MIIAWLFRHAFHNSSGNQSMMCMQSMLLLLTCSTCYCTWHAVHSSASVMQSMLLPAYTLHSAHYAPGMQLVHATVLPVIAPHCFLYFLYAAPCLLSILLRACRLCYFLHAVPTAPCMSSILLMACRLCYFLHAVPTAPCMSFILLMACRLCYFLHAVPTAPCMSSILLMACRLCYFLHAVPTAPWMFYIISSSCSPCCSWQTRLLTVPSYSLLLCDDPALYLHGLKKWSEVKSVSIYFMIIIILVI